MTIEVFEAIHRANTLMERMVRYDPVLMDVALASWVADPGGVDPRRIDLLAATMRALGEHVSHVAFAWMDAAELLEDAR